MQAPSLEPIVSFGVVPQKRGISGKCAAVESGVVCPEPHQPHFCGSIDRALSSVSFPTAQSGNESCAAVHSVSRSFQAYFVSHRLQLTQKGTENLKTHAIGSAMARRSTMMMIRMRSDDGTLFSGADLASQIQQGALIGLSGNFLPRSKRG